MLRAIAPALLSLFAHGAALRLPATHRWDKAVQPYATKLQATLLASAMAAMLSGGAQSALAAPAEVAKVDLKIQARPEPLPSARASLNQRLCHLAEL